MTVPQLGTRIAARALLINRPADKALKCYRRRNLRHEIPVGDAANLIHARLGAWIAQREARLGNDAGEITQNCLHFIETEVTVIHHRNAAEGMADQMFRSREGAEGHRLQVPVAAVCTENLIRPKSESELRKLTG